jgi:hypothetical protein
MRTIEALQDLVPAEGLIGIDVLLEKRKRPGLEYLDRMGRAVPW